MDISILQFLLWLILQVLDAASEAAQQAMEGFVTIGGQVVTSLADHLVPRLLLLLFLALLLAGGLVVLFFRAMRDAQHGAAADERPQAGARG